MDGLELKQQKQITELKVGQEQLQKNSTSQMEKPMVAYGEAWASSKWLEGQAMPAEPLGAEVHEAYQKEAEAKKLGLIEMPKARQTYAEKMQQAAGR